MLTSKWFWFGWLSALFFCGVFVFVHLWQWVSRFDHKDPPEEHAQVGIVLGAALWNQQPSPAPEGAFGACFAIVQARESGLSHFIRGTGQQRDHRSGRNEKLPGGTRGFPRPSSSGRPFFQHQGKPAVFCANHQTDGV